MGSLQRDEEIILNQLIHNEEYFRKVIPHVTEEYFLDRNERLIFKIIKGYAKRYQNVPKPDVISVIANKAKGLSDEDIRYINGYILHLLTEASDAHQNEEWLIDHAERFCQDKAMYNAVLASMAIINGDDDKNEKESIPDIMREALRISFDESIGLEYDDAEERYRLAHESVDKIPFDIEALNFITKGGLAKKTLNCILAGTGVGKTIFMCHRASSTISQGKNVLYITMEMSEQKIAERIDANLMNIKLDEVGKLSKESFLAKIKNILNFGGFLSKFFKRKKLGRLIIKEYPTGGANVNHFRSLLDELAIKKDFVPDEIIIDYLNICSSSRVTLSSGSYAFIKSIAEEIRGLAVERSVPILTGTQTNRNGFSNSDVEMGDTAESFGLPHTLDLYIAIMSTDELEKAGKVLVKQLKNRYADVAKNRYFTLGLDKPKMRFVHLDDWNAGKNGDHVDDSNDVTLNDGFEDSVLFSKPVIDSDNARKKFGGASLC